MRTALVVVAVLGACGDDGGAKPDAPGAIDAPSHHTGTAMAHTLFLATEGLTLSPGDDATMDQSTFVTVPKPLVGFLVSDPDRATRIAELVTELETILAPYDISIVNTRPASGPYHVV